MKKILLTISLFFLLTAPAWATTYYVKIAGGNYSSANTFSATSSAGIDNAGVPTSSIDVVMDAASATTGALVIDAAAAAKSFDASSNVSGSITHNAFNWTISGSFTLAAAMTAYTPLATSTITISATGTLTSGGKLLPLVTHSGGNLTVGDNLSFMASKVMILKLASTGTFDMNGKTINGNSSTNRLLIQATTLGTAKTITNATTSFTNADFRDITFSTAGALNLSGITGGSGDCGGNSITGGGTTLTFTAAANPTTVTGNSANWSTATWDVRVPLPQDTVVISLTAGQTLTADMPRVGKDISFTTATKLTLENSVTIFGSLNLTGMGTLAGLYTWTFESQARSGTQYLTSGGTAFIGGINISTVGATFQLADAVAIPNNQTLFLIVGAFVDAGFGVSTRRLVISGDRIRSLVKTGNWLLTSTGAEAVLNLSITTNLTISDTAGSFTITDTGANLKTFQGAGFTYYDLTTPSGTGGVAITGANLFNTIQSPAGGKIIFPASTITTLTGDMSAGFGNGANTLTLLSSTGGTAATLDYDFGGTILADYLNITDINVTPSGTWYYGSNSTYVSGTGWNVGSPVKGLNAMKIWIGIGI